MRASWREVPETDVTEGRRRGGKRAWGADDRFGVSGDCCAAYIVKSEALVAHHCLTSA
jgi:hypothetical protein